MNTIGHPPGDASGRAAQGAERNPEALPADSSRAVSLLFAALVVLVCCWVLSLPLFPTQDGPMHKYYVHAIASLLSGSHSYQAYSIRHPFPPYAIHYAILLGLTRIFSFSLAEKILVCGGCANIPGVADVISSRVGISAEKGDPLGQMKLSSRAKAQAVQRDATALLTACGLALRSFD